MLKAARSAYRYRIIITTKEEPTACNMEYRKKMVTYSRNRQTHIFHRRPHDTYIHIFLNAPMNYYGNIPNLDMDGTNGESYNDHLRVENHGLANSHSHIHGFILTQIHKRMSKGI